MQAVILAAGMGNRLGSLTSNRPKALVRVAGRELILRVMDFLDHSLITERIVVTGYMSKLLDDFLKKHRPDVKTIHNHGYRLGSIKSIETALPLIKGDFLILNTDHIYPKKMLDRILEKRQGLMAVCDFDRKLVADDMKVKLGPDGKLSGIRKTLSDFDGGYIGMTYCSRDVFFKYREGVAMVRKNEGEKASVEAVLGELARANAPINICDTTGMKWFEVDTKEDLAAAEKTLEAKPDFLL